MGPPRRTSVERQQRTRLRHVALVALFGVLVLAVPAAGHADLVTADPAPNSELDAAPMRVTARFSESVEDTYTGIEVEDSAGVDYVDEVRVDEGDRRVVDATLRPLPDGVFTVRWRTLSQADGHTRSGSFLIAVNDTLSSGGGTPQPDGGASPIAPPASQGNVGTGEVVARWLGFFGAVLAFGMPLAALIAAGVAQTTGLRRFAARAAAGGAALAALAGLALGAALASRIEADLAAAFATTNGAVLLQRIVWFLLSAVCLGLAAVPRVPSPPTWSGLGVLFAAAGLWATAMGGHAAADSDTLAWHVTMDWLHQAGVAFWVSGVALLLVAGLQRLPEAAGAHLVARFSPAAVAAVLLIIATGIIATVDRLPAPGDLIGSTFGLLVLAKVILVVPLVVLGAYHRFVVLPRLRQPGDEPRDVGALRRSAGAELAIMVVILLLAGALTSVGPPVPGADGQTDPPEDTGPEPFHVERMDGFDLELVVEPVPPTVGFQELFVYIVPHEGEDINLSAVDVFATFIPPSDPFGEASPVEGHNFGGGQFHFGGAIFTEAGNWTMKITVQGEVFGRVDVPIEVRQRA